VKRGDFDKGVSSEAPASIEWCFARGTEGGWEWFSSEFQEQMADVLLDWQQAVNERLLRRTGFYGELLQRNDRDEATFHCYHRTGERTLWTVFFFGRMRTGR